MMQMRENGTEQMYVEVSGQFTIWKLKDWKEKIFPMIDWHFANRRWRNHNGKYSNSYGGS